MQCQEEDNCQQRLVALLTEAHRRSIIPSVVDTDLSYVFKDLRHFYFVANSTLWSEKFHFESLVRDQLGLLCGWQNVKLFSILLFDRFKY